MLRSGEGEIAVLAEFDVRILPLSNVLVGDEILLVQGLVEFLEYLPGIDEGLDPGPFNNLLFVTLPACAVNEIVIERPVFVRMLQVQSAGFDPALNVQEEQGLVEGDPESPLLGYLRLFLRVEKGDRRRFVDSTILFFEMLDGVQQFTTLGSPWKVSALRIGLTRF